MTRIRLMFLVVPALVFGLCGPAAAQPVLNPGGGGIPAAPGPGPNPPPPPPPPPERTPGIALTEPMWVAVDGQATGPFQPPEIAKKVMAREIIDETMVFTNSMNRWARAGDVAALQPLLKQAASATRKQAVPAVPQQGDREETARFTQFMLGEWVVDAPNPEPGFTIRTQMRYLPNATFRGFFTITGTLHDGRPMSSTKPWNGSWSVQPIDDRRFLLTIRSSEGATSAPYQILDQSRLRSENDGAIATRIAY